ASRRLHTDAVFRAHQDYMLAPLERERRVREELLVAGGNSQRGRLDHRPAAPRGLQEVEAQRLAPAGQQLEGARGARALLLQPLDLRQLRLGLLGLALLVAE